MVFAGGEFWDNTALRLSIDEAADKFGPPTDYGCATIYAGDISDRSTYRMIQYL